MDRTIRRVTGNADARDWYGVDAAAAATDHVGLPGDPLEELLPLLAGSSSDGRVELWLARAGGTPVAVTLLRLPVHDNRTVAALSLRVHPDHRRRGHGRAMLAHAADRARQHGRSRMVAEVSAPLSGGADAPGPAFAGAVGARPVLSEVRRILDVAALDSRELVRIRDRAAEAAAAYRLLQWVDRAPVDLRDDLAMLTGRVTTDSPMQELDWEPEVWTAERYVAKEDETLARGRRRIVTAAQDGRTGRLVGYTDIGVNASRPEVAYQWDTVVLREHRGHRLGTALKAANLLLLRQHVPAAALVNTWNADDNTHMIAINEALGFRPVDRWLEEQLELPAGPVAAPAG